jgi:ferredoxin-type protein NapH
MRKKRILTETLFFFLYNPYFYFFKKFNLYGGFFKKICTPGLNCYSCPLAVSACPLGALQAIAGGFKYIFSYYVLSFLGTLGFIGGRFICGWACPFGWFQEGLYKIPGPKFSWRSFFKWGKYIKIVILLLFVFVLPALEFNQKGFGAPAFCKYICPAGTLEAGIPLTIIKKQLRTLIGVLFYWKISLLLTIIILSYLSKRFFCRTLCPLGALYGMFNKISIVKLKWDETKCVKCNKCEKVCPMDLKKEEIGKSIDCIVCSECKNVCPTQCINFTYK